MDNIDLSPLAPPDDWQPDSNAALRRFRARETSPHRRLLLTAALAVVLCASVVALRPTHVFAQSEPSDFFHLQRFWYWFRILHSPAILSRLPDVRIENVPGPAATFAPKLPHSSALPGTAHFSAPGAATWTLANAPITLQLGAAISAEWKDVPDLWSTVVLTQGPEPVLSVPPGFDALSVAAPGFRNRNRVHDFARSPFQAAALLFGDGSRSRLLEIHQLNVGAIPALLIEDTNEDSHAERMTLLWTSAGRAFSLHGDLYVPVQQRTLGEATAVADLVGLAETIR